MGQSSCSSDSRFKAPATMAGVFRDSVVEQALSGAHADNIRPMGDIQILRDDAADAAQVHRKLVMTAAMSSL